MNLPWPVSRSSFRLLSCLMTLTLLIFLPALAHAATRKVPSQYATIQAAINAAAANDTVLVADGTYTGTGNRDLDFLGKSLTVQSEHGPTLTIIDCQGTAAAPHRAFYIHRNEVGVRIDGFTVKNGVAASSNEDSSGGGAFIAGNIGSVALTNCIFSGNTANGDDSGAEGGGAYISAKSSVAVTNCTFIRNSAFTTSLVYGGIGGGAYIIAPTVTLTNSAFNSNTAFHDGRGGGADIDSQTVTLTNCTFSSNTAYNNARGGGLHISCSVNGDGATTTLRNCAFSRNTAYGNEDESGNYGGLGGGVYIDALIETATLLNCIFSNNTAYTNNFIYGGDGGGAYIIASAITLTNSTFNANTASRLGGAAFLMNDNRVVTVRNCIAYGDTAELAFSSEFETSAGTAFLYSDIEGGYAGTGNINADPRFEDGTMGDFHLQPNSPCLGKGTHTGAPTTDLEGNTRPNPPSIGAYDVPRLLQTFSLSPGSVYGGETTTGRVTLNKPAPYGGTYVYLSSNTEFAAVPSGITIPAGATSQIFTVTSKPVTATKAATITASIPGVTRTASVLIYPPVLKYLTLSPTKVRGGYQNSVASVTLTSPAPPGGTLVTLSSNTGYASVPSHILVPAGGRVAAFTVTTYPVTIYKGATITATQGGVSKSVGLLLTPS